MSGRRIFDMGRKLPAPFSTVTVDQLLGIQPEERLLADVVKAARTLGWLVYHTHDSRFSESGYPDLTMARGRRQICAELKIEGEEPTPEQAAWLEALAATGAETYVWRPRDWDRIICILRYPEAR